MKLILQPFILKVEDLAQRRILFYSYLRTRFFCFQERLESVFTAIQSFEFQLCTSSTYNYCAIIAQHKLAYKTDTVERQEQKMKWKHFWNVLERVCCSQYIPSTPALHSEDHCAYCAGKHWNSLSWPHGFWLVELSV